MRNILLFLSILVVASTSVGATNHKKFTTNVNSVNIGKAEQRFSKVKVAGNSNPDLIQSKQLKQLRAIPFVPGKTVSDPMIVNPTFSGNSARLVVSQPDNLLDTFRCKGVSYFGGSITGDMIITADASDVNKVWLDNFVPNASNRKIYGTLSDDQKKISIPQGQVIYKEGLNTALLTVYNSSDDLVGEYNSETGVITFTDDLWGAKATDGWIELFTGSVTYINIQKLPPVASYRQPQGGIFLGLDPDSWGSYNASCIVSSPFVTWNWQNTNIEQGVSYQWSCADSLSGNNITSVIDSLVMDVEDSYYGTPMLKATNGKGYSSSSILGADYVLKDYPSYTMAGGHGALIGFDAANDYGCANLDNGFTLLANGSDAYYFGTGASNFSDADYESLLVYYEEPLSTLYFEGVNVYLFVFDAPDETPFTMNVVLKEKNAEGHSAKGKVVASSTIKAKDVLPIKNSNNEIVGYTMKFTEFKETDEDGFSVIKESMEMDKAFFLELTGFNVDGVSLAVCTEEVNPSDGDSRSCFMVKDDNSIYSWNNYRQTMYMNLDGAAYSYISLDKEAVFDSREGGTYEIQAFPFFDTIYYDETWIPDWVHLKITDQVYNDSLWQATINVTVDPLPIDLTGRSTPIVLHTVGATKTFYVNQVWPVSTNEVLAKQSVSAFKNATGFEVKYSTDFNTLAVYSASGAFIGKYTLPATGNYQLSDSGMTKGLYILKFIGNNKAESIKIVK